MMSPICVCMRGSAREVLMLTSVYNLLINSLLACMLRMIELTTRKLRIDIKNSENLPKTSNAILKYVMQLLLHVLPVYEY